MKLVIVDDHPLVRESVRRVCDRASGWRVVGETDSGATAIELIPYLRPDAIVLDLVLDDVSGFVVAERVRELMPELRILVLSEWLKEYVVIRLDQIGVQGFVLKRHGRPETLREALRALADGGTFFAEEFERFRCERGIDSRRIARILSRAEQRVLALVGVCSDDAEIGRVLGIAPTTAQTHRSRLLRKLELEGTPQLIAFSQRSGYALAAKDIVCEIAHEEIAAAVACRGG